MRIRQTTSSNDSVSSQASELHGSVDRLNAVFDTSVSLHSSQGSSSMARRSRQIHGANSPTRLRSSSCPAAIERIHVLDPDHHIFKITLRRRWQESSRRSGCEFPITESSFWATFPFLQLPKRRRRKSPQCPYLSPTIEITEDKHSCSAEYI